MKQQKNHVVWHLFSIGFSKRNWETNGMKFIWFTTKVSKFPNFLYFQQHSTIFGPFRKFTSIRNTKSSWLLRVTTGSVSETYQTNFFAQLPKTLLENVNFDLIYPIFYIQKPSNKFSRYSKGRCFELLGGLEWCKHSTTVKLGAQ